MACRACAIWDQGYLAYDFGEHPLNPLRLDLTIRLARELGVLERLSVVAPQPADELQLRTIHDAEYLAAVRAASEDPGFIGYGLGTDDDPVFAGMYDAAALICGGSAIAAAQVASGVVEHAVNIAGGLHHAMPGNASGFCIFNDAALGIRTLLAQGTSKVAYVDIDVHHGDGVQAVFYDDPRVLTISLHQDPRTLFPGTGFPDRDRHRRGPRAPRSTSRCRRAPATPAGCARSARSCRARVRAFGPDVLVTQCGCDTHHEDPLANLELTVDGQRTAIAALHGLAHEVCGGRWLAFGGGGYGLVRCVPRTWTHLLAEASGVPVAAADPGPGGVDGTPARARGAGGACRRRWARAAGGSRISTHGCPAARLAGPRDRRDPPCRFPLLGLDPDDPRD